MSTTIEHSININSDPQEVWRVLTDFASYSEWNPFMDRVSGTPAVGNRLTVHMIGGGKRGTTFKPTVTAAVPGAELRWLGKLAFGGLFDGAHFFILTRNADGSTRLTHGERFSGILVSLMKGATKNADTGFDAFNQALKQRVETAGLPSSTPDT